MFSAGSRKCPWGLKKIQWIHYNLEATRVHPVCWRVWVICMTSSSLRFPTDFSSVLPCSKGVSTAVTFWWKFEECVISYLKEFITMCLRKHERKGESKQQQNNKRETFPRVCVCVAVNTNWLARSGLITTEFLMDVLCQSYWRCFQNEAAPLHTMYSIAEPRVKTTWLETCGACFYTWGSWCAQIWEISIRSVLQMLHLIWISRLFVY